MRNLRTRRAPVRALSSLAFFAAILLLVGCSSTSSTTPGAGQATPNGAATATATGTSGGSTTGGGGTQQACLAAAPGSMPFQGVDGLQLPSGSYITVPTTAGGGDGQYTVQTFTICVPGGEAAIDGGSSSSAVSQLQQNQWVLNNLFPDPTSLSYLDYCSAPHICLNTPGTPNTFTFMGFDQFASQAGGVETARLQIGSMTTPICLNDVGYYSGTPKYTLYEDGNSTAQGSVPAYHFQMPPETRVSTFNGGGTAGSTYEYFCSGGTTATVTNFLTQSMQNIGWTVTPNSTGFSATDSTGGVTYMIDLNITYPNNYSLRVFVPQ